MSQNVLFKRGLESSLFTSTMTYDDGCFYLTTDTNRLYVGAKDGDSVKLEAVNEGVTTVNTVNDLPSLTEDNKEQYQGRFYYIKDKNILAVASGETWVQINPDTRIKTSKQNVVGSQDSTSKKITIKSTVDSENSQSLAASNSSIGEFTISKGDNVNLILSEKTVSIGENESIKIPDIEISAVDTIQTLSVDNGTAENEPVGIKISDSDSKVSFTTTNPQSGYGSLAISKKSDTEINFSLSVADQSVDKVEFKAGQVGEGASKTEGFTVSVQDKTGDAKAASINPIIAYGENKNKEVHFNDLKAELDVYSIEETDGKIAAALKSADAMTFKGVIEITNGKTVFKGTNTEVSTKYPQVQAGDTYKVYVGDTNPLATASFFGVSGCRTGDLLIAKEDFIPAEGEKPASGTNYSNGEWYLIPSGDDQIVLGSVDATTNNISISDNSGATLADLTLAAGTTTTAQQNNDIVISSEKATNTNKLTTTISHKKYTTSTTADNTKDVQVKFGDTTGGEDDTSNEAVFTAITGYTSANGHITELKTSKFTVADTHNQIDTITTEISDLAVPVGSNDTKIEIKTTIIDTDTNDKSETFTIESSSLEIKAAVSEDKKDYSAVINLVWGTF